MAAATMVAAPSRQVFLSYAPPDRERATELARALTDAGLKPWLPDAQIWKGDNWALATGQALEESTAMVAIISQPTGASREVNLDLIFSLGGVQYDRRVIPILLEGAGDDGIPWILAPYVVHSNGDWSQTCAVVAQRLADRLREVDPD